jgi:hypothetical protein
MREGIIKRAGKAIKGRVQRMGIVSLLHGIFFILSAILATIMFGSTFLGIFIIITLVVVAVVGLANLIIDYWY